jgi:SAM-dependent methyltransferase
MDLRKLYEETLIPCQTSLVFDLLSPLFKNKRVLDIGCSTGDYLLRFPDNAIGIDLSRPNLAACRRKELNVLRADLNSTLPFIESSFDVAFCTHVLEHVESPLNLLREVNRILCDKGKLVLSVPIETTLVRVILNDDYFKKHPSHLYSFTMPCLIRLLDSTGFIDVKVIWDFPLMRRFKLLWLLRLAQFLPNCISRNLAGNMWVVGGKV